MPTAQRNIIILLGGPGAGKGTQAKRISDWLRIPHISSGQLLRFEVDNRSALGLRAKALIDAGKLVDDDIVTQMILQRIHKPDCGTGFILDGYPRHVRQTVTLETSLPLTDRQIVIDIVTDIEKTICRLTNRRTCAACGAIYHLLDAPPRRTGVCNDCGNVLIQRTDDQENVIRQRFNAYRELAEPLTSLYRSLGVYHAIDGMRPADDVAHDIRQLLERDLTGSPSTNGVAAD